MQYPEDLKIALSYTDESSKRCRWILFVLQLAVVLVLASVWQEARQNWVRQRLETAQEAVRLLECKPSWYYNQPATLFLPSADLRNMEDVDRQFRCAQRFQAEKLLASIAYLQRWKFSLPEARKNVADLQETLDRRNMSINVPVLGLGTDINDLSLFSGLTLSFFLAWLYFSMRRHQRNVMRVFTIGRNNMELKTAYTLLAMSQVLTLPPRLEGGENRQPMLRHLLFPVVMSACIAQYVSIVFDLQTFQIGKLIDEPIAFIELGLSCTLFVAMMTLAGYCLEALKSTGLEWSNAAKEVREKYLKPPQPISPAA